VKESSGADGEKANDQRAARRPLNAEHVGPQQHDRRARD